MRYLGSMLVLVMLSGCSTWFGGSGGFTGSAEKGPDGVACVGQIPTAFRGLAEESNPALLAEADEPSGGGGVCSGKVFKVVEPIRVYRVYDASRGASEYGRWWSLTKPAGTRDQYRASNAICPEWSELNHLISCQIKSGAQIVVGTTQSANCGKSVYPKSANLQVFVENNELEEVAYTEQCTDEGDWPQP